MNAERRKENDCLLSQNELLSREKAEEIFNHEAVYLSNYDCIPCHRVTEIFGEWTEEYSKDKLENGSHRNAIGTYSDDRPLIYYLSKQGFLQIVAEYNYRLLVKE